MNIISLILLCYLLSMLTKTENKLPSTYISLKAEVIFYCLM